MPPLLSALNVKTRLISAILIRILSTDYGSTKVGYLSALIKPLGQIIILTTVFTILGRRNYIGESIPLFLATGLLPYNLCIGISNKLMDTNKSKKKILINTPLTAFDISIGLMISEALVLIITYIIILIMLGSLGYWDYSFDTLLGIMLTAIASIILGFGIGLFNISMFTITPSYEKIWKIVTMPLFLMSGVLFVADRRFPAEVLEILKYNPILHLVESMRGNFYRSWESTLFSSSYLTWWIIGTLSIGLTMQKITQAKPRK